MDLKSDTPYLLIKNGLMATYPPLGRDLSCEAVVLGGGVTGALIADRLTKAGVDVILLDRRDIANGSSSVSTGLLQYEIDVHLIDLAQMIGEEDAVAAYRLCGAAIGNIAELVAELADDCAFHRRPSLYFASRASDARVLEAECAARRRAGFEVDLLSEGEIKERFGFAAPAAILSQLGAQIDPYRLTHRLLERSCQRGLRVFDRTEATRWQPSGSGVRIETNREAVIETKQLIVAAGFESQNYLKQPAGKLKSTYAVVSQALAEPPWEHDALIWETARPYLYLRRTEDGRILLGGEDDDFQNPLRRDARVHKKAAQLEKRFASLFPHIPLEIEFAWGGTFGETKDGLAYIGPPQEMPYALFALGYGGNGITFSQIASEIICDAVLGRPNPHARLFRFGR